MISNIYELTSELISTGKLPFHQPRLSDWKITGWGTTMVTVDVADVATAGAAAAIPVNVDVGAGKVDIALYKPSANLRFKLSGIGGSFGVAAGWGIPFVGGKTDTAARKVLAAVQDNSLGLSAGAGSNALNLPNGGIGTLVAGVRAPSAVAPRELEGITTLVGGDLDFGPNGLGAGLVMFADRPIIDPSDLIFVQAYGLVADIHLSTKVAAGVNYCSFKTTVEIDSLAAPGAYYGMSIPK